MILFADYYIQTRFNPHIKTVSDALEKRHMMFCGVDVICVDLKPCDWLIVSWPASPSLSLVVRHLADCQLMC